MKQGLRTLTKMNHPGINCDVCNKTIQGFRYKCLECDDFDLCQLCESDYHSGHVLCRFTHPVTVMLLFV